MSGPMPVVASVPALDMVANKAAELLDEAQEQTTIAESVESIVREIGESLRVSAASAAAVVRNAQMTGAMGMAP